MVLEVWYRRMDRVVSRTWLAHEEYMYCVWGRYQGKVVLVHQSLFGCSTYFSVETRLVTISTRVSLGLRPLPPAPLEDDPIERDPKIVQRRLQNGPESLEAGPEQPSCLEAVGLQQAGR